MLAEIYIENIALVTKLRLTLGTGFNVFTGETGAGKSILLDAMSLMLGAKADTQLVRHGAEKAIVEGVFCNLNDNLKQLMEEYGVTEDNQLILTREISHGRSACRINGRNYPLNIMREFGERLVNIYGQHDFQTLMKPENHLQLIDAMLPEITNMKSEIASLANNISKVTRELKDIEAQSKEIAKEIDFLTFQAKEIDDAQLSDDEEEELVAKQKLLANAEKIATSLSIAYDLLYGGQKGTISDLISEAVKNLQAVSDCGAELQAFTDRIFDISANCDDLALEIKSYLGSIEFNQNELEITEERLYVIKNLKRKYGESIKTILEYRREIEKKLNLITYKAENEQQLKAELTKSQTLYIEKAQILSSLRAKAAEHLRSKILEALSEMNMSADLQVNFTANEGFSNNGRESAVFFIRTNKGEALKPLAKIASGGELARFMLAVRTVLNTADPVATLVFDEVDAGMGGVTLSKVTDKLYNLSQSLQIFCVTHSAQLAAKAKAHFLVKKQVINDKTHTTVELLNKDERVQEIARMLDGQITNSGIIHAAELLKV